MEIICNEWMTYIDRIVIYDNHINVDWWVNVLLDINCH